MKSDDIVGRVKTYEAIIKGNNIPAPGVPESFKVLIKELQALSLDIKVLAADKSVIEIPRAGPRRRYGQPRTAAASLTRSPARALCPWRPTMRTRPPPMRADGRSVEHRRRRG